MQNYQDYLNQRVKEFQAELEYELIVFKKNLQADLNQEMLENIKFAKKRIEAQSQIHLNSYKQSIEKLTKKRNSGNLSPHMFDFLAKTHKKKLESDIQTTKDNWVDFINKCQDNTR